MSDENKDFFTYKGKPLVKNRNEIYYGSMLDDYVVLMKVSDEKEEDGQMVPNNIIVQLMHTDKEIDALNVVVKKSEKVGLYSALEIADIWLTRALADEA